MASSDTDMTSSGISPTTPLTPPSLEELSRRGVRSLLLPWIIGLVASSSQSEPPREVVVLVNLRSGSITMIEGSSEVEALMLGKDGALPASKASIEAMPVVEVKEEGFDCPICLTEFEVNGEAKEMPCKHKYHSGCIEKWLEIHGSCPICRYRMPSEEVEKPKVLGNEEADGDRDPDGGEGRRDGGGIVFRIFLAGSRRSQSGSDSDTDSGRYENETGDGNSDAGSGSDGEDDVSATQEMDIDR